jgi:putative Ca2+/H+ antiporter (TMEM165/GDT1 family)
LGVSTAAVAIAEIGDKTQLLAFALAGRWRAPWSISAGILAATLANHALAGALGAVAGHLLDGVWFQYVIGAIFLAFAAWMLVPDKLDDDDAAPKSRGGVFLTTLVAFFLVEMGDKTQLATVALGAQYASAVAAVVLGTTLGMMIANVPAVFAGQALAGRINADWTRIAASVLFAVIGVVVIVRAAMGFA